MENRIRKPRKIKVECSEEKIEIISERVRIVLEVEDGLEVARQIEEYYFMEEE